LIFYCFCGCLDDHPKKTDKVHKKEMEERKKRDRFFDIQFTKDQIKEKEHEKNNIKRTIYLNAIGDSLECQIRRIESQEAQYDKEIEN